MDYQQPNSENQFVSPRPEDAPYSNGRVSSNGFAIASFVCGLTAIAACCCTVVFSVPFAALSILFAVLSKRKGQGMSGLSIAGITTGVLGLVCSLFLLVYVFVQLPALLKDPYFRRELDETYEEMYGMDFEEFWDAYGNILWDQDEN